MTLRAERVLVYSGDGNKISGSIADYKINLRLQSQKIVFVDWRSTTIPGFIVAIDEIPMNGILSSGQPFFAYLSDYTNVVTVPEHNLFSEKAFTNLTVHISAPDGAALVNGTNGYKTNHIIELIFYSYV